MSARGWFGLVVAVAAVLLLAGRTVTALYVDHAWYTAMGAPALFWEQVVDTALLQGSAWLIGAVFAFGNLHAVRRTILAVAVPSRVANLELTAMVPGRRLLSATIVLSVIVGGLLAVPLTHWETLALVRHGLPFGEIEGIFDRDLGHYVYWLPFEETLYLWALVSVVALTAMVLVMYALTRSLRLEGRRIAASSHVRRHLSVLGALVLLLLAWSYRLDAFDLLLAGSGPDGLFLRVDHRVTLRVDYLLAYGSAIAALIMLRTGWAGQLRAAFVTLSVVLVAAVVLRHGLPAVLERGDTLGDPARRDADYVAARALYSRRAYDVDAMRLTAPADGAAATAGTPVQLATATLGARAGLWNATMLDDGLGRPVGEAREETAPATDAAPDGDRTRGSTSSLVDVAAPGWLFVNGRLMALRVARPAIGGDAWRVALADVTSPALRDSVVEPPAESDGSRGTWPLVAPGLSGIRLLDASVAAETPGARLDSPRSRIAHAWALRDVSLLDADARTPAPLLVTYRDVRERLRRLAPVFAQGTSVSPLRDGNRLYWALHLYSASDRYPFAQRWQVGDNVFTYYKLAATALVDAQTGRVRLVPAAHPDALARTWMTRLPRLFAPASSLSPTLAAQLPPATDAAALQLRTFARYGSRAEGVVLRHAPDSAFAGGPAAPVMLPRGGRDLPAWTLALLNERDAVAGVATVVGGADGGTYWTPVPAARAPSWGIMLGALRAAADSALGIARDGEAAGPARERRTPASLPAGRMSNDSAAPPGREGTGAAPDASRARLGIPEALVTSRGVLVLQTMHGTAADGRPQLRGVAITDGRQVRLGRTLADALSAMGEAVDRPASGLAEPSGPDGSSDHDSARRWYRAMRDAMKQGNWSAFGAAFDSLGRSLGRPPQ